MKRLRGSWVKKEPFDSPMIRVNVDARSDRG